MTVRQMIVEPTMLSLNEFQGWALTGTAGIIGAFGVWLRLNKTQTEIIKTQGEGGWITQLVKDRDSAQEREKATWALYIELKEENAKLKMQAVLRDEKIERREKRLDMLTSLILEFRPELEMFLKNSGYGDLPGEPVPFKAKGKPDSTEVDDG